MKIKRVLKNRIVRNASWLIGGKIAQSLVNLAVGVLTAIYLAPTNYGLINYAGTYIAFFSSLCTLGINSVIVKEFIDNRQREGEIIGTSLLLKFISSVLSVAMILGIVMIVDAAEPLTRVVVLLCSISVVFQIFDTFHYWFQSRLESRVTALTTFAAYLLTAAYKVYLIVSGKDVRFFAAATALEAFLVAVFLWIAYRRHKGSRLSFSRSCAKSILKKSCHYILPAMMVSIYGQTDKMMLKQMISSAEVGYYAVSVSICTMWCFVLTAIIDSMNPSIMKAHKDGDDDAFIRYNKQLYAIVFYLSLTVSLGITLLSKPIVSILYGQDYLPAVVPLSIITWYTAFSYLGVARNAWIVCQNKQRYLIWVYLSAAVVNVALNAILIPTFRAPGAAAASLLAQVITTMVAPFFIRPLRPNAMLMLEAISLKGVFHKSETD